jgi:hypothetical protein
MGSAGSGSKFIEAHQMWFTFITARLFFLRQLPTSPRGDAVDFVFRCEQSNSTGGTLTHVSTSFAGAALAFISELISG